VEARITIADSGSTDSTWLIANRLALELPGIRLVRLPEKGRGRALRTAWESSDAAVLAYMDVDLSTDLAALLPLVAPLLSGHSDLAIGTRLANGSRVIRGPKRELISRAYNAILRTALGARFTDAQCGFKAIRGDLAADLLAGVEDQSWFFDTELLVLAEHAGLRIHEVPVDWTDDPNSTVDLVATARADLRGVLRLLRGGRLAHQVGVFSAIGVLSTIAYVALYAALRKPLDPFGANALALGVTAVANTAANRRLTFGLKDRAGALRHQIHGLGVFALALALTSASLGVLHLVSPQPDRWVEVGALLVANAAATALRFVLLRYWVFKAAIADAAG
ncbi:MAG TPA: glycosyltransferase, partial [Mycobacteriales bacterium]|nr:glycosyltransferase [Mycobacteriales bacterium]